MVSVLMTMFDVTQAVGPPPTGNNELREDASLELREDGSIELRD